MAEIWADQPFKLIPTMAMTGVKVNPTVSHIANEMVLAHNAMIRGLNSMYLQAPYLKSEADNRDILLYAKFWIEWIHHHHECEEEILFPGFERVSGVEGMMAANVVQHHEFTPGFDIFVKYVKDCLDDKSEERFAADKFRQLIDGFAPKLTLHLADEIPTLLSLDKYDEKKLNKVYDDFEKVVKDGDFEKDELYPMVVGAHDKGFKGGESWPPIPIFVTYLVAYWLSRKYRSVWRFNPCDFFGKRRPLVFGPTAENR
ncbi:hypothetical protein V495_00385 [Pseudogymnoascus sp. VKM F-4514 (FW-929)]|nr:hypothetical protein V495_00385 [Pseudogymnoascus sp. VKM F-4514 (FW-929)]KFY66600.1 hypothetical protein V497_00827 [Pseudogymnoascus sp. VKM F-4516 (FW-969)]